jgi:hypothetical protein
MGSTTGVETAHEDPEVLHSLLQIGVNLTAVEELPRMLDMILSEVRKIAQAEAGTLYILQKGGKLRLAVAQNDRVASQALEEMLVGKEFPLTNDSLVGFVASTGQEMSIPNSYTLPPGSPFRINREFDSATGYRIKSIIAMPLQRPDGRCIGVLQLFNRLGDEGKITSFDDTRSSVISSLASMAAVTIHNALLQEELKNAHLDTIIRLSVAAEFRDDETAGHIRRVTHASTLIAKAMDLTPKQVEVIRFASPMHDLGKIGIPDRVLQKPGRLDEEERRVIEEHPLIGTEILGDPLNDVMDAARAAALTHHERWDGTGYPNGLAGEDIPIIGRIVGLADVFDALVSKRCYRDALPLEKALEIIREEDGKQFDPAVVKAFFKVLGEILEFYQDPAVRDESLGV